MKQFILCSIVWMLSLLGAKAQQTLTVVVKDGDTQELLAGAGVYAKSLGRGVTTGADGRAQLEVPGEGKLTLAVSFVGYETETKEVHLPVPGGVLEVTLEADEEMLEEVVVTTMRSTRTIQNIPTRVEFISSEELGEKGSMKPGDIRMLLNESTGIITQQTSAISGNASIRIQGLDGRYTQILKDGFPVFAGAASGLGLLQTPPLDLKQVEIIKGSTSTLYGGGAIAGLVNLISKTPGDERELGLHLNATTAKGMDVSTFYGQRFGKIGTTVFASYNRNGAYDPSDVGLTAIPKFDRRVFNPTLFLYPSERTEVTVGVNAMTERRLGGDMEYVKGRGNEEHSYFERNRTQRYSTRLDAMHRVGEGRSWNLKNSFTYFTRALSIPDYCFDGTQLSSFTELNYMAASDRMDWVGGLNLWTDRFEEEVLTDFPLRDYDQTIAGAFVQNTWKATERLNVETGLRTDYVCDYGWAVLPRLSLHYKFTDKFSSRLGGGFGYKAPTIFTEDSERIQFRGVHSVDPAYNKLERSYGANIDFNYTTGLCDDQVRLSVNQLFFYTYLHNPLLLETEEDGTYRFYNRGHTDSKGSETNVKLGYKGFHLYLGYTYTDVATKAGGIEQANLLTPKHRLNSILMYEVEDEWKVGLEAYYFSRQRLGDGLEGRSYWVCGCMVEKIWENFSVYANFENFTDRRQTRFDSIYTGSITQPVFRDIYAPLDGFVMNAGVKLRF